MASDTSKTECHFCFGPASSLFLELLVTPPSFISSLVNIWSGTGGSSSSIISFAFSSCSWGSPDKSTEVHCHLYSTGPNSVRTLHYDLSIMDGPAWLHSWLHWVMQAVLPWQGCDPWRGQLSVPLSFETCVSLSACTKCFHIVYLILYSYKFSISCEADTDLL